MHAHMAPHSGNQLKALSDKVCRPSNPTSDVRTRIHVVVVDVHAECEGALRVGGVNVREHDAQLLCVAVCVSYSHIILYCEISLSASKDP